jgi:glycine hydroxymethyltransferase
LLVDTSMWVCPHLQSNCHAELLPSMWAAFKEMEVFGMAYAQQMVRNAKALANQLHELGLEVSGESFGFTETHQVHFAVGTLQQALAMCVDSLHAGGIRSTNIEIPGKPGVHGIRLGAGHDPSRHARGRFPARWPGWWRTCTSNGTEPRA